MVNISTLGLTTQSILQIRDMQQTLGDLSNQLSTGKKSLNLADYTLSETKRILDFRNSISKKNAYLDVINTVEPRLKVYDQSMTQLESVGNQALALVNTTQNATTASAGAVGAQLKSFIDNVEYYLNQKVGDRYIFSGSRYSTAPVKDLSTLPVPPAPTDTSVVTNPAVPTYDTGSPTASAASYTKDTATLDDGYNITYGVSSNDPAFQNLVLGLRWAYAATQDPTNYTTYMNTARGLLSSSLPQMRDLHGTVAANQNRLAEIKSQHTNLIADLTTQIDNIQKADSAEVAAKITFTQSQLEASYSVTAKIAQLSLTKYL